MRSSSYACLSSDGDALVLLGLGLIAGLLLGIVGARLAVQEAALLDRASSLAAAGARDAAVVRGQEGNAAVAVGAVGRGQVGDVLGHGVLAADGARVDAVALASLGHGIVAAVEVLAVLQVLGEVVRLAGQLAIQAEESLLIGREGLCGSAGQSAVPRKSDA